MAAETYHSEKDIEVARAVARELASSGGRGRVTVRELRERFGRTRLTTSGRTQISEALAEAGVTVEPSLEHATSLDDPVVLGLTERRAGRDRRRVRLLQGGVQAWKVIVGALGLIATLAGLYTFVTEMLQDTPPKRLTGDMNVAVAPFTASTRDESRESQVGELLAGQVRSTLGKELNQRGRPAPVTFDVAPPPKLQPVGGETAAERTGAAARTAATLNAQLVVYGDIRLARGDTIVAPRFYLSGQSLGDADELVGSHRLGAPVVVAGEVSDDVAARVEARRLLAARTRTLSNFVVGLSYFGRDEYKQASRWFRLAELTSAAAQGEGSEVISLFRGHAAGRSGAFLRARRFYVRALDAEPEYARARFGIAEVQYQLSRGGCTSDSTDEDGLRKALRGYLQAEAARTQPYAEILRARARFGRARVLFCLGQAGVAPRFAAAEELFREVVRAYERGEALLRDEASEALAGIGLIRVPGRSEARPARKLREAEGYYLRAIRLSGDDNRRALFLSMLGFIYTELGELTAADRAYLRAGRVDPNAGDRRAYERARRALKEK